MHTSADFLKNAQECMKLAQETDDPRVHDQLVEMAERWLRLAENAALRLEHPGEAAAREDRKLTH
jgi:hypothetical protein